MDEHELSSLDNELPTFPTVHILESPENPLPCPPDKGILVSPGFRYDLHTKIHLRLPRGDDNFSTSLNTVHNVLCSRPNVAHP